MNIKKSFGEIHFPDGFKEELAGKSIEEQAACYAFADAKLHEMSYHMTDEQCIKISTVKVPIIT